MRLERFSHADPIPPERHNDYCGFHMPELADEIPVAILKGTMRTAEEWADRRTTDSWVGDTAFIRAVQADCFREAARLCNQQVMVKEGYAAGCAGDVKELHEVAADCAEQLRADMEAQADRLEKEAGA